MAEKRRNNCISLAVILLSACLPMPGSDVKARAGGFDLTLPVPEKFEDVGERFRTTVFELMVPSANRLVGAFAPAAEIAKMNEGRASGGLAVYAMIQVPRQLEYTDCTPQTFQQMLKGAGAPAEELAREQAAQEMNLRLKSFGQKSINVGGTEDLGSVFRKTDAYGSATLATYSQDERSVTRWPSPQR